MPLAAALPYIMAAVSVYSAVNQSKAGKQQASMQPPSAPPQSQVAKTPEQNVFKAARAGGDPTLLTGPAGVKEDDLLLGKSTLLGS